MDVTQVFNEDLCEFVGEFDGQDNQQTQRRNYLLTRGMHHHIKKR